MLANRRRLSVCNGRRLVSKLNVAIDLSLLLAVTICFFDMSN